MLNGTLRLNEILRDFYPLKRATFYVELRDGLWPAPLKWGGAVYWLRSEAEAMVAARNAGLSPEQIKDTVRRIVAGRSTKGAEPVAGAPSADELLLRLGDAIEALDGTSVENEQLVDDYRAWLARRPVGVVL